MGRRSKKKHTVHPDVARIQELESLEYDAELTDEQFRELETLRHSRRESQVLSIPRPTCCKEIQEYPAVYFAIDYEIEEGKSTSDSKGDWTISIPEMYYQRIHRDISWFQNKPSPKFCPFCGTPLPRMRKKTPLPPNIAVISHGGYYCETCGERCMNCRCDPPESIWEEDK